MHYGKHALVSMDHMHNTESMIVCFGRASFVTSDIECERVMVLFHCMRGSLQVCWKCLAEALVCCYLPIQTTSS